MQFLQTYLDFPFSPSSLGMQQREENVSRNGPPCWLRRPPPPIFPSSHIVSVRYAHVLTYILLLLPQTRAGEERHGWEESPFLYFGSSFPEREREKARGGSSSLPKCSQQPPPPFSSSFAGVTFMLGAHFPPLLLLLLLLPPLLGVGGAAYSRSPRQRPPRGVERRREKVCFSCVSSVVVALFFFWGGGSGQGKEDGDMEEWGSGGRRIPKKEKTLF